MRRATADEARDFTGFSIGGIPPFGHDRPIPMYVDEDLLSFDEIWAAAGLPDAVFPLTPDDLLRASGAHAADLKQVG